MSKVLQIAFREFLATVATKGFIIGVLLVPILIGIAAVGAPLLLNEKAPRVEGELAVVDATGNVTAGIREFLKPEAIAERRGDLREKVAAETPESLRTLSDAQPGADTASRVLDAVLGGVPKISVVELPADADLEREKAPLREGEVSDGGRLALAVIHSDAVVRAEGKESFGTYDLFVRDKMDDRIEGEIKDSIRRSIIDQRVQLEGLDREWLESLTRVGRVTSTTVTDKGEQETNRIFNILLPMAFMILLLVSVMTSGQYILSTTIEEKSSRVVEVVLSAVSPMQLLTGKVVGQLCVGLLILGLYSGLGVSAAISLAVFGLIDPTLFIYLLIFYLIAYFIMGSLMAAIGSAVNEIREAQSFMAPVMMIMMIPWVLWMPITQDPNSTFATVTSFIPPINSFVILLRMTSTAPPPMWQVWLSILIGVATAYVAIWFAAKVFRIGLLLHGKPPNFATLIKWVRMA